MPRWTWKSWLAKKVTAPSAASLRGWLAEMPTITRLGAVDLGEHLARHQLESMIEIRRDHAGNGKRRRDRVMGLRWVAAAMARPTAV